MQNGQLKNVRFYQSLWAEAREDSMFSHSFSCVMPNLIAEFVTKYLVCVCVCVCVVSKNLIFCSVLPYININLNGFCLGLLGVRGCGILIGYSTKILTVYRILIHSGMYSVKIMAISVGFVA
jgi:hypothetical protein